MRSREKQLGSILLVLIVGALAAMLAVIVAGLSLNQLALSKQSASRGLYQLAGDSVTSLALSELQDDPTFGQPGHPQRNRLFRWTGPEGEEGFLTFDPGVAASNGIEASVNNFTGTVAVDAGTRKVPPGMILLRGYGKYAHNQACVEAVVRRPPFAFAISATGDLNLEGTAVVGELPAGANVQNFPSGNPDLFKDLLPAHIRANGDITLSGNVVIQGNATAGGQVVLSGTSEVRGDVVTEGGPIGVSQLNVSRYDPPPGSFEELTTNFLNSATLSGYHRYPATTGGGLLINGPLTLNDGVLFVDGDLTVRNGLHGNGAVISTGNITIQGATRIEGFDRVALMADQGILLQGSGPAQFQGAVYANGNITARGITVAGSIIGAGSKSDIELDNALLAAVDGSVDLSIMRQGFHRNAGQGNRPASGFGPENYSYVEEAELLSPTEARVRRMSFHPNVGTRELGLGEVNLSTNQVTGDLSQTTRESGATAVINNINQQNNARRRAQLERSEDRVPASPIQALHYINFYSNHPADDFDWIRNRTPADPAHSATNFKFRPNEIFSPGQSLKIYHRKIQF